MVKQIGIPTGDQIDPGLVITQSPEMHAHSRREERLMSHILMYFHTASRSRSGHDSDVSLVRARRCKLECSATRSLALQRLIKYMNRCLELGLLQAELILQVTMLAGAITTLRVWALMDGLTIRAIISPTDGNCRQSNVQLGSPRGTDRRSHLPTMRTIKKGVRGEVHLWVTRLIQACIKRSR